MCVCVCHLKSQISVIAYSDTTTIFQPLTDNNTIEQLANSITLTNIPFNNASPNLS